MDLPQGQNPSTTIEKGLIYERPYVRFIKNIIELDGQQRDYSYADIADGVGIVALNAHGEVALVGQWRHPIQRYNWEIPAGMHEAGEDPLATAKRELQEEAGATAKRWQKLGEFFMDCSGTTKKGFLFLAQDLSLGQQSLDEDERLEVLWLPFAEALQKTQNGEIHDGFTALGLNLASQILARHEL